MSLGCADKNSGIRFYLQEAQQVSFERAGKIRVWECAMNPTYGQAWENAERLHEQNRTLHKYRSWHLMEKECYVAIMCYTLKLPNVSRDFNAHCRRAMATEASWNAFPYKSLWYFLIRAFEKLPPFSAPGGTFFRGVEMFRSNDDHTVSFVQFVSASVSNYQAAKFGRRRYLLTLDCVPQELVRDISFYSVYEHHKEVLIWPFCTFKDISPDALMWNKSLRFSSANPWVAQLPSMKPSLTVTSMTSNYIDSQMSEAASFPSSPPTILGTVTVSDADVVPAVPAMEEHMAPESAKMTRITVSSSQSLLDAVFRASETSRNSQRRLLQEATSVAPNAIAASVTSCSAKTTRKTSLYDAVPESGNASKKVFILQEAENTKPRAILSAAIPSPRTACDEQPLPQSLKRTIIVKPSSLRLVTDPERRMPTAPSSRKEGPVTACVLPRMATPNSPGDETKTFIGSSSENQSSKPKRKKTTFLLFVFRSLLHTVICGRYASVD
ncbi:uncharacterized protein LOC115312554 [Ixodes scapularis]|uniref:uncharacterized protein LOC115312554 n=1 Tax=Ixodes scapularis TaxID=6945 RepID=UPI001C38545E|nr:uncharacterized protein LOC115312554 [Ixodes scapularis]